VSCTASSNCVAAGSRDDNSGITPATLIERWNGLRWALVPSPNPPRSLSALSGISCVSASLCMAVGDNDNGSGQRLPLSEQWNGTAWTIISTAKSLTGPAYGRCVL
jgi:hypothetical protein